ncbi:MAG: hypothetical protein FJ125_08265 [Deltaproteobacteria bacterium]|nr:hypothetical protein [Deltaproteobacteria bacterium]
MDRRDIEAFVQRDRCAVARLKLEHWAARQRETEGLATMHAGHALFEHARRLRPDLTDARSREADLQHHVELKHKIDQAAHAFSLP